jgi:hypothetical protein
MSVAALEGGCACRSGRRRMTQILDRPATLPQPP